MSLWKNDKPPVLYPDAVATPAGWADPVTGELLVTVTGLSTFKGGASELKRVHIVGNKKIFADGDYIVIEADFTEKVTKTGTPTIAATINGNARTFTYFAGDGTNQIRFRYQVAVNETATPAQIVFTSPISGTFTDVETATGTAAAATATITSGVTSTTVSAPGSGYTSAPTVVFSGGTPTRTAAATAVLDRRVATVAVTAGGTGYTSAPTVAITSGGGTGATGTAVLAASGAIKSVTITSGGSGGTNGTGLLVTFTGGGGTGAAATATIAGGVITVITMTSGGSGYTSAPTVSVAGQAGSVTLAAVIGYAVASVTVTAGGTGFTSVPTVGFSGGAGTGAAATATLSNLQTVASLLITDPGAGYTGTPTISFTGGAGSGAAATATRTSVLNTVTVTAAGTAYWVAPTIGFSGGGGTGAAATATVDRGRVTGVTITNYGSGYSTAPTLAFTSPALAPPSNAFPVTGISTGFSIDAVHPTISSVVLSGTSSANNFVTNDKVTLTLTGSKILYLNTSGGVPYIDVTVGSNTRRAVYKQGHGSNTLVFTYEIIAGDSATATNFSVSSPVVLNGGTIKDYQGNTLTLTFTPPTTTAVVANQIVTPAFTGAALSGYTSGVAFNTGSTVTVTLTANMAATVATSFGTPFIEVFIGNKTRFATYASGSGSTSLVFTYTTVAGDSAVAGTFSVDNRVNFNGGTIKNGSNNFPGRFPTITSSTVTSN